MMGIETMKTSARKRLTVAHSFREAASGLILRHRERTG